MSTQCLNTTLPRDELGTATSTECKENRINVLDLTLLLKVMGFRLHYLDYEGPPNASSSSSALTVEIKCGKQNLVSRLSAPADVCGCPGKSEEQAHDSSFWEVTGTAPSSSPGGGKRRVQDASSNLLPELSKRGTANTKQLLHLIHEGFRKDHLPSATTTSPEQRPTIPLNPMHTSTVVKSPQLKRLPVIYNDVLLQDEFQREAISPLVLMAPPNTPRVQGAVDPLQSVRHKDHLVYLEVMAARERLDKALLAMKLNIAGELEHLHGPALDLSAQKIFEEVESPLPGGVVNGMSPATFVRRSSMGSFPNIKSKVDADGRKKQPLVRNKSSIDTGAATKAKSAAAVTSRYLLPKKTAPAAGDAKNKPSPLAKKTAAAGGVANGRGIGGGGVVGAAANSKGTANAKRSPIGVGWK